MLDLYDITFSKVRIQNSLALKSLWMTHFDLRRDHLADDVFEQ